MIEPDGLLDHARKLAGTGRGRPPDADLRRGVSAAYYSVFHDITERAARHLIGSSPENERNKIRRSWSHGEIAKLADLIVERAAVIAANPAAPMSTELKKLGPLVDIAARDGDLVSSLRLFIELQERRHQADYDHSARFDKLTLLTACTDSKQSRDSLHSASASAREALFSMLTLRRSELGER